MIIAGVGFNSNCGPKELAGLIRQAQETARRTATALAAPAWKAQADCLTAAAELLALPVLAVDRGALMAVEDCILTQSAVSRAATGVGSVAEAAALAAAGPGSRLVLARISSAHATCALSEGAPS